MRKRNETNKIIIHCSASDIKSHDNIDIIKKWHVIERGWSDIGYHYVITQDGLIHTGRDVDNQGAHCTFQNEDSIGICLTGLKSFSDEQVHNLRELLKLLCKTYNLENKDIYAHNEYDKRKTCPNFPVNGINWIN